MQILGKLVSARFLGTGMTVAVMVFLAGIVVSAG